MPKEREFMLEASCPKCHSYGVGVNMKETNKSYIFNLNCSCGYARTQIVTKPESQMDIVFGDVASIVRNLGTAMGSYYSYLVDQCDMDPDHALEMTLQLQGKITSSFDNGNG